MRNEDTNRYKYASLLVGEGLEIGALHRPMVKHSDMDVKYVDLYTSKELEAQYPELDGPFVEADIIDDGCILSTVEDSKYDFLIAAHVIEHCKNPLQTFKNWLRVLKPEGLLYFVTPDYRKIFDRDRPLTTVEHMVADYYNPSPDRDRKHYMEWASLVDKLPYEEACVKAAELERIDNRIHFHTFTTTSMMALLNFYCEEIEPIIIASTPHLADGDMEFHTIVTRKL